MVLDLRDLLLCELSLVLLEHRLIEALKLDDFLLRQLQHCRSISPHFSSLLLRPLLRSLLGLAWLARRAFGFF